MTVSKRVISGFGTAVTGSQRDFFITQSPGQEIKHLVFGVDRQLDDLVLDWELIHPADSLNKEVILLSGCIERSMAQEAQINSLPSGTVGYHRPVVLRIKDDPVTGDVTADAKTITELMVAIEFETPPGDVVPQGELQVQRSTLDEAR